MKQSENPNKDKQERQSSSQVEKVEQDSTMVTALERLAFQLHDLANRLMSYLR